MVYNYLVYWTGLKSSLPVIHNNYHKQDGDDHKDLLISVEFKSLDVDNGDGNDDGGSPFTLKIILFVISIIMTMLYLCKPRW